MKLFKKLLLFCSLVIVHFIFPLITHAANEGIGFEVRPILPSSQIDKTLGYYYIQTEPGVKQNFELSVYNTKDKDINIEIFVENAISASVGNIGYTDDLKLIHSSLTNPVSDIVKIESNELMIKPQEEAIVKFEIIPPTEHYSGAKMGRIIVKEKSDKNETGVLQKYQYGIGIVTSESGEPFNDGSILKLEAVKPNIHNGSKVIIGHIVNPEPRTIENLKVDSYVTKKGSSKKIKERKVENFSFAPNSMVDYQIPWGLTNFETGEYTFHFIANNEFESFKLEQDFKIRANDAKNLNKEAAFSVGTPTFIKLIIVIINFLLLFVFGLILFRNRKWVKELKSRKKGKRKKGKRNR